MQTTRLVWIDQAKGFAILMVILVHLSQILPLPRYLREIASFGALGVQLFFILSAYCLCLTDKGEMWSFAYLMRKYKRFCPWYWAAIVLYFCYGCAKGDVSAYTAVNIGANLLLINAFIPSAQNTIVPGGWSISCIALFAFLFPLITRMWLPFLLSVGILGVLVAFAGGLLLGWTRFFAYCCPFNQFIVFVFGIVFWRYRNMLNARSLRRVMTLGLIGGGGLCLCIAAVLLNRVYAIYYRQILISLFFVCGLAILKFYPLKGRLGHSLDILGRHSYELFITHFAVLWILRDFFL